MPRLPCRGCFPQRDMLTRRALPFFRCLLVQPKGSHDDCHVQRATGPLRRTAGQPADRRPHFRQLRLDLRHVSHLNAQFSRDVVHLQIQRCDQLPCIRVRPQQAERSCRVSPRRSSWSGMTPRPDATPRSGAPLRSDAPLRPSKPFAFLPGCPTVMNEPRVPRSFGTHAPPRIIVAA